MLEASKLALLRRDVDRNSTRLKSVLRNADLRREFFKGIPDDERKAVKAFISHNQDSALKTKPKVSYLIHDLLSAPNHFLLRTLCHFSQFLVCYSVIITRLGKMLS